MKYIPLSSLQNSYSSVSRYRGEANSVSIDGFYPENSLNIPVENIDSLGVISGTSFRFIIKINEGGLYTSDSFYNDLVRAKQSKNPYFVNTALNPKSFVNISIAQLRQTFNIRTQQESPFAVTCIFNNLFDGNGSVNYQRFGEYIDWVVSKPELNDVIDNGILNSNRISQFNVSPTFDYQVPEIRNYGGSTPPSNGGGSSTGGGGSLPIDAPDTNDLIDPTEGPGIDFGNDIVNIPDRVIIDNNEYYILPPNEPTIDNIPQGGNEGNRNPFLNPGGNPNEDLSNEYTVRYRNTNREL